MKRTEKELIADIKYYTKEAEDCTKRVEKDTKQAEYCAKKVEDCAKQAKNSTKRELRKQGRNYNN